MELRDSIYEMMGEVLALLNERLAKDPLTQEERKETLASIAEGERLIRALKREEPMFSDDESP